MDELKPFLERVERVARPALETALRAAHRSLGGDGRIIDYGIAFEDPDQQRPPKHEWDRIDGFVFVDQHEAWCRVWLDRRWLRAAKRGTPTLIDDVFVIRVDRVDDRDRPTQILGVRALPSIHRDSPCLMASPATITWSDDTATAAWDIEDPHLAAEIAHSVIGH